VLDTFIDRQKHQILLAEERDESRDLNHNIPSVNCKISLRISSSCKHNLDNLDNLEDDCGIKQLQCLLRGLSNAYQTQVKTELPSSP